MKPTPLSQNEPILKMTSPVSGVWAASFGINEIGFTLLETLVAVAVSGIAMLIASSMLFRTNQDSLAGIDRNEAEISATMAELYLRTYLGAAVDLVYNGNSSLDGTSPANGQLRSYDSNDPGNPATASAVALFQREVGGDVIAGLRQGAFNPTGIYFIQPTATTSGVLFFATSTTSNSVGPSYSVPYIGDLVEFQVQNPKTLNTTGSPIAVGDVLTSVDVRYVVRYFEPGDGKKVWCPNPSVGAFNASPCASIPHRNFHDVIKAVTVVFRDNPIFVFPAGGTTPFRPLGKIYSFPLHNLSKASSN